MAGHAVSWSLTQHFFLFAGPLLTPHILLARLLVSTCSRARCHEQPGGSSVAMGKAVGCSLPAREEPSCFLFGGKQLLLLQQ